MSSRSQRRRERRELERVTRCQQRPLTPEEVRDIEQRVARIVLWTMVVMLVVTLAVVWVRDHGWPMWACGETQEVCDAR